MHIEQLVATMSKDVFEKLKIAIETGKWLDGNPLSDEQKETVLQAILLYQAKIEQSEEHMTVNKEGKIVQKSRQELQNELKHEASKQSNIARFKENDF
ncbi:YeaC family protein [Glaciecola petra]|uniref:DUF1315 family protein n=1 Tax=Glaciecola petra TaxID=3075602 RepID=A0ABU2ZN51_9ALTE|nr:DUF1315 family protein [Aestuariibacter sp. P117]MDT0594045.1 DUF1315 family protein [Aestuariibacter sp. P117]